MSSWIRSLDSNAIGSPALIPMKFIDCWLIHYWLSIPTAFPDSPHLISTKPSNGSVYLTIQFMGTII